MLVSVLVAGDGEAELAAALEGQGVSATPLGGGEAVEGYDLAILLARPEDAASPATRASVAALSAASERLLLAPLPLGGTGGEAQGVLPELPSWFELFAEFGYQPVVEFDASFLSPGAFLVGRAAIAAEGDLAAFADRLQSPGAASRRNDAPPMPAGPAQPSVVLEYQAALSELRASLAASQAESAGLSARLAELRAKYDETSHALAQAQAQAAGWDRLRLWVRLAVSDTSRDSMACLARDLAGLNALRVASGLPTVSLPRPRRRWFRRRAPASVPPFLQDAALVRASPLFDAAWYAASIPALAEMPLDPVFHYLLVGAWQGADPGPWFDGAAYRSNHPELGATEVPLVHAIRTGAAEGIAGA